jgi:site-specific DNA-methyltransferase (adenine-specific)
MAEMLRAWLDCGHYDGKASKGFMGTTWDAQVPQPALWKEVLRVLKPGGHMLAFSSPRNYDLMGLSVRLAGFEIRDCIRYLQKSGAPLLVHFSWVFGSGFPKSLDISKKLDEMAGMERKVVGQSNSNVYKEGKNHKFYSEEEGNPEYEKGTITAPASEAAKKWAGWHSSLKPAWEAIVLARKPLSESSIAENVLKHGTGALNIDATRIPTDDNLNGGAHAENTTERAGQDMWTRDRKSDTNCFKRGGAGEYQQPDGRYPANLAWDGSGEVAKEFPSNTGGDKRGQCEGRRDGGFADIGAENGDGEPNARVYADTGSVSRFFYCGKATRDDRDSGLDGMDEQTADPYAQHRGRMPEGSDRFDGKPAAVGRNIHPCCKPVSLMRWLVRLCTPEGGVVLDPFMGSGSTGKACMLENFRFVGVEMEQQYIEIARRRIAHALKQNIEESRFTDCDMFGDE